MDTTSTTSDRQRTKRADRGLTLIEICVAIAVVAIVAASAAPSVAALIDARRLDSAATRLAADLDFVRNEARARNRGLRLTLQAVPGATCWIVHSGAAAQCACRADGPAVCSGGASEIKTVVLPANERVALSASVGSIAFDPLHGTSTPTGTLRLVDARGRAVHHVVNVVGRVRSCSPGGAIAGYPTC